MRTSLDPQRLRATSSFVLKREHQPTDHPNHENIENGQTPATKKRRMKDSMENTSKTERDNNLEQRNDVDTATAPSVKALKGWLSDFEKQQKDHFKQHTLAAKQPGGALDRGQRVTAQASGRPNSASSVASTSTQSSSRQISTPSKSTTIRSSVKKDAPEVLIARNQIGTFSTPTGNSSSLLSPPHKQIAMSGTKGATTGSSTALAQPLSLAVPGSTTKLLRFKPRVKKEEVQATDEKNASVQKIAEWLQDDPFEKRKLRTIRKGAQVIAKSRTFESDSSLVLAKGATAGQLAQNRNVADRQKWLKSAFKHGDEEGEAEEVTSVSEKAKWLEKAFNKRRGVRTYGMRPHHGTASDLLNDSDVELTDQKEGLSNSHDEEDADCTSEIPKKAEQKHSSLNESQEHESEKHGDATKSPGCCSNALSTSDMYAGRESGAGQATRSTTSSPEETRGSENEDTASSGHSRHTNKSVNSTRVRLADANAGFGRMGEGNNDVEQLDAFVGKENSATNKQVDLGLDTQTERSANHSREPNDSPVLTQQDLYRKEGTRGVLQVATAFGGVAKPSSVQRRRLALEQKAKEMRKKADPRSTMLKTTWESSSGDSIGNGNYSKRLVDHTVPKKSLSDLP